MKRFLVVLVCLFLAGSLSAETIKKNTVTTSYGYNEKYDIDVGSEIISYYVPYYADLDGYKNDSDLWMLQTFNKELNNLHKADMHTVGSYLPNTDLHPDVKKVTKKNRITVGYVPGGYIVINLYFSDTDTFGTFLYY